MSADTYKETKTYFFDNAVVRVHTPGITDDERARRMQGIKKAAAKLLDERK